MGEHGRLDRRAVTIRLPPPLRGAALLLLILSLAATAVPDGRQALTWRALLAPYSHGAPLAGEFRVVAMRRGSDNDVVLDVRRAADGAAVEVHILARGRWPGVRESASFGIAYETPRSPAAEREAVTAALAEALRARDPGGLPAPDAIPLGGDHDPTALPWPLEALRGGRGVLVGLALLALGLVAVSPDRRLAWLGVAIGAAGLGARAAGAPAGSVDLGGPWLVPVAAGLAAPALWRDGGGAPADYRWACGLGLGALLLRLGLGAWGPLHVNGYGPLFILAAAREPQRIAHYGPGFSELYAPLAALAPRDPDWAIFAANAAIAALLPPLAYGLGRLLGLARPAAAAAGLLAALDPVAIRMATSESYLPAVVALSAGAAALLLLGARALDDRHASGAAAPARPAAPWRGGAAWIAAALLLAQAVRIHPSAWAVAGLAPVVLFAAPVCGWRRALGLAAAATAVCAGVIVATSGGALLDVLGALRAGTIMRPPPPPSLWPLAAIAAGGALYAFAAPRPRLALPAALALAVLLLTRHGYGQSWLWQQAYDRLYLLLPLLAGAALLPARLARRRRLVVGAGLLLAAVWFGAGLPIVSARTTDHLEYRWVRAQLAGLPADCRVSYLALAGGRSLVLPTYVGAPQRPAVLIDPRAPHTLDAALAPTACHLHIRPSLCASTEGRVACDAIAARLRLEPIARATFPARPSTRYLAYDQDPVETVVFRVLGD